MEAYIVSAIVYRSWDFNATARDSLGRLLRELWQLTSSQALGIRKKKDNPGFFLREWVQLIAV